MALYPTKVLLDKNKKPFIPFVTAESIKLNNTDKSLADMLYDRYTKEEVDNIIKNLGTIQVLRGRVDTYEDLLAIENPQAGDVYIVGTSETDNAEYMYIGTTWEKLGPLVDLSTLVTLDELASRLGTYATIAYVDALIKSRPVVESETSAAMSGEELHLAILNNKLKEGDVVICTSDYLNFETGHLYLIYSTDVTDITPTQEVDTALLVTRDEHNADMISRPTFEQTNQMIDNAIGGVSDARVLKYIGHFPDKDSLPFTGQASAVVTDPNPYTLTQNFSNAAFDINQIKAIVSEPYFIGYYANSGDYTLIGFTDKNSITNINFIPDVNRSSTTSRVSSSAFIEVHMAGSATNPIKIYSNRSNQGRKTDVVYRDLDSYTKYQKDTPRTLTTNVEICLAQVTNLCSNVVGTIFKHIPDKNGWLEVYGYNAPNSHSCEYKKELVLQFANNFVYSENMAMLKFDANCQPMWLTDKGDCAVNDVLSYGDNADHLRFDGEKWANMGIQSSEVFNYVDTALGTAEAAVDAIIDGGA